MRKTRIFFHTLGCSKNLVDSETLFGFLSSEGCLLSPSLDEADMAIINTCAFIKQARRETFGEIRKIIRNKGPRLRHIVVAGCVNKYMDRSRLERMFPEVDEFISPDDYGDFTRIIKKLLEKKRFVSEADIMHPSIVRSSSFLDDYQKRYRLTPPHYAYVKISEGCSNNCSYCVIPLIKGPLQSRSGVSVIGEVKKLTGDGVKEVNIIAQDSTAWGSDIHGKSRFLSLLRDMVKIKGDFRIRLLYMHPRGITRDLVDFVAGEEKICSYIDMPVQHISDRILALMNRKVSRGDIEGILEYGRKKHSGLAFRTSIIVGFPGETKKEFRELCGFIRDAEFDRLGVFAYSLEKSTPAGKMSGQISEKEKKERVDAVMGIQSDIARKANKKQKGKIKRIIVEGPAEGSEYSCWGRSEHEAPDVDPIIFVNSRETFKIGGWMRVAVKGHAGYDLLAEEVK